MLEDLIRFAAERILEPRPSGEGGIGECWASDRKSETLEAWETLAPLIRQRALCEDWRRRYDRGEPVVSAHLGGFSRELRGDMRNFGKPDLLVGWKTVRFEAGEGRDPEPGKYTYSARDLAKGVIPFVRGRTWADPYVTWVALWDALEDVGEEGWEDLSACLPLLRIEPEGGGVFRLELEG